MARSVFLGLMGLIMACTVIEGDAEAQESIYRRIIISASAENGEDFSVDNLYVNLARGVASWGHGAILLEECGLKEKCFDIGFFKFSPPSECEELKVGDLWRHKEIEFKIESLLSDRNESGDPNVRALIRIRGEDESPVGAAIYSLAGGLEAFMIKGNDLAGEDVNYYLSTGPGLFSCRSRADKGGSKGVVD